MREIFRGWRRKLGCITLVVACILALGWARSLLGAYCVWIPAGHRQHQFIAADGIVYWWAFDMNIRQPPEWDVTTVDTSLSQAVKLIDAERGNRSYMIPSFVEWKTDFWLLVLLPTLPSAYLILSKSREQTAPQQDGTRA